jgi:glycosyltransferase involved in cell wall biosynthesis
LIQQVIGDLGIKAEIIVVDGGSVDDTKAVVAALNARFILQTERGYGGALLAGFAAAARRTWPRWTRTFRIRQSF